MRAGYSAYSLPVRGLPRGLEVTILANFLPRRSYRRCSGCLYLHTTTLPRNLQSCRSVPRIYLLPLRRPYRQLFPYVLRLQDESNGVLLSRQIPTLSKIRHRYMYFDQPAQRQSASLRVLPMQTLADNASKSEGALPAARLIVL